MKQVKLSIPTEWSDITIGTYQKYVDIQLGKGSEKKKIVDSLALLCGTTTAIVKKMNYKDLIEIMDILKKMIDAEPDKQKFRKTFVFKDEGGSAHQCNILIKPSGSQKIDNQNQLVLESPHASLTIYTDGASNYFIT